MTNRHVARRHHPRARGRRGHRRRAIAEARGEAARHRLPPRRVLEQDPREPRGDRHQLATITELVLLLHQESLAPPGTALGTVEVDRILADFEDGEGPLRELVDIGIEARPSSTRPSCSRRMGG